MAVRVSDFEDACHETVGRLRAAMIELYDSVGADPANPQEVARTFGINKTLTWNIARMIQATSSIEAIPHVPGSASIEKVIRAVRPSGANPEAMDRVRTAARAFDEMVEVHVGDRSTLELITDGMASGATDRLELSRKLAFRGNSGIFGVQAKTRLMTWFIAPNADDPSKVDIASVTGYAGFRRLRSSVRWPLFKLRSWSSQGDPIGELLWQSLEGNGAGDAGAGILGEFTRGNVPDIEVARTDEGVDFVLPPGPVGNFGAFDCFRGEWHAAAANRYRMTEGETGEFGVVITTPTEHLVFDIIAHEDLAFALTPDVLVFARVFQQGQETGAIDEPSRLPINAPVAELVGRPPAVATPLVPRYAELVRWVHQTRGWDPRSFRGVRMEMKYPPLGAQILLRFDLPDSH